MIPACRVRRALGRGVLRVRLALAHRRLRGVPVIGITGGVGKTSTKDLLAAILSARGRVARSRGSWNGPLQSSYGPAIEQLRAARTPRKVAVLGTVRHAPDPPAAYRDVLARVSDAADQVFVVGPEAAAVLAAWDLPDPARVRLVPGVAEARDVLRRLLQPGDLVLLKGSMEKDHLARLALDRVEPVACWRTACGRKTLCDACELLRVPETSAP